LPTLYNTNSLEEFVAPKTDKQIYFDYSSAQTVHTNEKAINDSIRNILLTRIGSVPGKPSFGSSIHTYLFDLMSGSTVGDLVKIAVLDAILTWEPRVQILDVTVKQIPEYNRLMLDVTYDYVLMGKTMESTVSILLAD